MVLLSDPNQALTLLGRPALGEAKISLEIGPRMGELWIGAGPYPQAFIDRRRLPNDIDLGASWVALSIGQPELERGFRDLIGNQAPDPWAEGGTLRELTGIIRKLLLIGSAVVLPRAGDLGIAKEEWLRLTASFADPAARPFRAWVDVHLSHARTHIETTGMSLFGLPEVRTQVRAPDQRWIRDRALEAVLLAAQSMVHQNRALEEAEHLPVPVGARVGAYPLEVHGGDAHTYQVTVLPGSTQIELMPKAPVEDGLTLWAKRRDAVGPNTYATLLETALLESLGTQQVASWTPEVLPPNVPEHTVQVLALPQQIGGFLTVTQGIGRRPRPQTQPGDPSQHLELVTWSHDHGPKLASLVSTLAAKLAAHPGPLRAGDTLELEELEELRWFVLVPARTIPLGSGPAITLFEALPLEESEHTALDEAGAKALVEAVSKDPELGRARGKLWAPLFSGSPPPGE